MNENLHERGFRDRVRAGADAPPGAGSGSDRSAADDEHDLGAALAGAIGDRVDAAAPPVKPPMAAIADLAAARARRRTARRTVMAAAASVAVVGGVVWSNVLERDTATNVIVAAIEDDDSSPLASAGTAQDDPAEPAQDDPAEPASPTPEELSTGPVLQWTEIDPGFADLFNFESLDDGRVLARAWGTGDERVIDGERAVYTDDGIDWTELRLPGGIIIRRIDISGERWLAWGRPRSSDDPREVIDRVFYTDDRGANWTELLVNVPPDPEPVSPYCERHLWVDSVLASGERIVLVVDGYVTEDAQELLADGDLLCPEYNLTWIMSSDGSDPELAALYEGYAESAAVSADGFAMRLVSDAGDRIVTSADGLIWSEEPSFRHGYLYDTLVAGGALWRAEGDDGSFSVARARYDSPFTTLATFEDLAPTGTLAVGSSGLAATAFPSLGGRLEAGSIFGLPVWRDAEPTDQGSEIPQLWMGWSADGTGWGWQTMADSFGIDESEGEPWAQLAVGRDFVIARIETVVSPTPEEIASWSEGEAAYEESLALEAPPLRWFIARVP